MIFIFFQALIIGYSGALMPGSLLTYTIDKSLKQGQSAGFIIALGHSILELLLVSLLLGGVGTYLAASNAKIVIGFIGGAVLIFCGITMIKDVLFNKIVLAIEREGEKSNKGLLLGGAIISASNPYFIFWWAAVGLGLVISAYNQIGTIGVVLFYLGHISADISWYSFISIIVSRTRKLFSIKVYKGIIVILAFCLIGFGFNFFYSSVKSIL